ncbi:hypothetical protein CDD81_1525 [Ophiocordyceps australis]|uniref:Uncharacterized protein n=1 Tax=Ophiocordyceps australis TaxID=1399860 RepID=A0A2C5XKL9_9HYPO|nr:hypothetical protein CDD81_1525 [Ophiocordyceps australis]
MASWLLPSYGEATTRADWLAVAAPYVAFSDFTSLCLVSRRCWALFAPRLWCNVLVSARRAGLDASNDLAWWLDFAFGRLAHVAPATRALVRLLDATDFAKQTHLCREHQLLLQALHHAVGLLPRLSCLVVAADPSLMLRGHAVALRLLSLAHCPSRLPASLFALPALESLVYLDASSLPGSLASLLQPGLFCCLRVLKLRSREIDNATLAALARRFGQQLWSLDVSDNRLTDAATQMLCHWCIAPQSLPSAAHFDVEGALELVPHHAPPWPCLYAIRESQHSAAHGHAQRYLVDPPAYAPPHARLDGQEPPRCDSLHAALQVLALDETDARLEAWRQSRGLTHVHVDLSCFGIQDLVRMSRGHLEHLDCASVPLLPRHSPVYSLWPPSARLHGMIGASHLFRPVWSSNLRTLRIHHSLVTQLPTLQADALSPLARLYLAETLILPRVQAAYPQDAFVPSMNPRLTSLTLTCIPRRSAGPLISSLIDFVRLLAVEEGARHEASLDASWRHARLLQGLTHLTLEFEPDAMDDEPGFSFFNDQESRHGPWLTLAAHSSPPVHGSSMPDPDTDHVLCDVGSNLSLPVWIGSRHVDASSSLLRQYRRNALEQDLRDAISPATRAQVQAGAPRASLIFQKAWCATVMPSELDAPAPAELAAMRDVLAELKAYRASTRACYQASTRARPGEPHCFWTGRLQVVLPPSVAHL